VAACLLHFRNTSFASLLGDRRDLVGLVIRPYWLKTLSLAAELHGAGMFERSSANFNETETRKGRGYA